MNPPREENQHQGCGNAADELGVIFLASGRRYVVEIIHDKSLEADLLADQGFGADFSLW